MKAIVTLTFFLLIIQNVVCLAADNSVFQESESVDTLPEVIVRNYSDPLILSYSDVMKGLEAYDLHRILAPNAQPRFRAVYINYPVKDPDKNKLTLSLKYGEKTVDIPLADDQSFTLPAIEPALEKDAQLRLNRNKDEFQIVSDIHSPNEPINGRRLGDLRLQCEMNWAFFDLNFFVSGVGTVLGGPCHNDLLSLFWRAPKPLAAISLVYGDRQQSLPADRIKKNGLIFSTPLNDQSWPNDSIVKFEFTADKKR
jgi:hypothetical protein